MQLRWIIVTFAIVYWHRDIKDIVEPLIRISKSLPAYATFNRKTLVRELRNIAEKAEGSTAFVEANHYGRVKTVPGTPDSSISVASHLVDTTTHAIEKDIGRTQQNFLPEKQDANVLPGARSVHPDQVLQEVPVPGTLREKAALPNPANEDALPGVRTKPNTIVKMRNEKQAVSRPHENGEAPYVGDKGKRRMVIKPCGIENTPPPKDKHLSKTYNTTVRNNNEKVLDLMKKQQDESCKNVEAGNVSDSSEPKLSATIIGLRPIYTRETPTPPEPTIMTEKETIVMQDECDHTVIWNYGLELLCGILYSTVLSSMLYLSKNHAQYVREHVSALDTTRLFVKKMRKRIKLHAVRQDRLKQSWSERRCRIEEESEKLRDLLSNIQHYTMEDKGANKMKLILDSFALTSEHLSMSALEGFSSIGLMDQRIKEQEPVIKKLQEELLLWESILNVKKVARSPSDKDFNLSS